MKDAGRCSGTYSLLGRYRALTMSVFVKESEHCAAAVFSSQSRPGNQKLANVERRGDHRVDRRTSILRAEAH